MITLVIGDAGAGKTRLTQKIAFDYANGINWNQYDFVLLLKFRLTADRRCKTIIDLVLNELEQRTGTARVSKFLRENIQKCKLLVILDGFDEIVNGQCQQFDEIFSSYGCEIELCFDLIVTMRLTKIIDRNKRLTFLEIVDFDTNENQREYIAKHFANDDEQIESVISTIENNKTYRQLASTPMLLTFICLVHSKLKTGTRVELYENVVDWFIRRKLDAFSNLFAELNVEGEVNSTEEWYGFEQIRRLGYISWLLLAENKYQFNEKEIATLTPRLDISIFTKIGLLIVDSQRNQPTKYQFAHRTLHEYFAAMFLIRWESEWIRNGIEYQKANGLWMIWRSMEIFVSFVDIAGRMLTNREEKLINRTKAYLFNFKLVYKMFVEIMLAKRDDELNDSVRDYLMNTKWIHFEIIESNDRNESWRQLEYVNKLLAQCQRIEELRIDLQRMTIDETIELMLPTIDNIHIVISNGVFEDNSMNMISMMNTAARRIHIRFERCQFSFGRLMNFTEYVDRNVRLFSKRIVFVDIHDESIIDDAMMNAKRFGNIELIRRSLKSFVFVKRVSIASRLVSSMCAYLSNVGAIFRQ